MESLFDRLLSQSPEQWSHLILFSVSLTGLLLVVALVLWLWKGAGQKVRGEHVSTADDAIRFATVDDLGRVEKGVDDLRDRFEEHLTEVLPLTKTVHELGAIVPIVQAQARRLEARLDAMQAGIDNLPERLAKRLNGEE